VYQLLLTRKYLFSKVLPLLAAAAVLLCAAMVLVVWSVMGGFLTTLINSGRTMTGDVIIAWPNSGFPHYNDLVQRLEKSPKVQAAAPMIESFGLLNLPNGRTENVILRGIDGPSFARVTKYADTLWWRPLEKPLPKDKLREDVRLGELKRDTAQAMLERGLALSKTNPDTKASEPAVVMGIEVSGLNYRSRFGFYEPQRTHRRTAEGERRELDIFLPLNGDVTITVPVLDSKGQPVEPATKILPVVNEFQSGIYEVDNRVVLMRLDAMQSMLRMNAAQRVVKPSPNTPPATPPAKPNPSASKDDGFAGGGPESLQTVEEPPRVTSIMVRGKSAAATSKDLQELKDACREVYGEFDQAHRGQVPSQFDIQILTWEDQNRTMINAVKKETGLLLVLFMIISTVAIFMILAIFYSIISEKTRDIGVLRAIGASRAGIATLWTSYGLALGIVGSSLGLALAYTIVWNINPIHEWMGEQLGIVIWDPSVYYFFVIPNRVDPNHALYVWIGGVVSAVLGAAYPAIRAAFMDPVKSLRFE
jgi:lipoprotein-releasing system permease protein